MTDRPIIFSAPMVRALLDGRKTQTRRVLKPQPDEDIGLWLAERSPPYAVGDRLWVRENWQQPALMDVQYKADPPIRHGHWNGEIGPWRPSIHMPRWASRLTLTVTDVRVQRLQEISRDDALAEGALEATDVPYVGAMTCDQARDAYALLWDHLHGPGAWDQNPWVVAISFETRKGNIDA